MRFLILLILTFTFVLSSRADLVEGLSVDVAPSTEQDNIFNFHVTNSSSLNYFCRSIKLSDIHFYKDNFDFYALPISIKNKNLLMNQSYIFKQDFDQDYEDILKNYPNIEAKLSDFQLSFDCSALESRMNKIYAVVDDVSTSERKTKIISYYINSTEQQIEFDKAYNFELGSNSFIKLNYSKDVAFQLGSEIKLFNLDSISIRSLVSLDTDEEMIAAFDFKESVNDKMVFVVTATKKMELKGYFLKSKGSSFEIKDKVVILNLFKKFEEEYKSLVNYSEFLLELTEVLSNLRKSISVKKKVVDFSGKVHVLINYAIPNVISYYSNVQASTYQLSAPKAKVVAGGNLFYGQLGLIVEEDKVVTNEINTEINSFTYISVDKFYNYFESKVTVLKHIRDKIQFGNKINEICKAGECEVISVFSDSEIYDNGISIDSKLLGITSLIRSVQNENYKETRELIAKGANVNIRDIKKHTAIYYSLTSRNYQITDLLLANGALATLDKGLFGKYLELELSYLKNGSELAMAETKEKIIRMYKLLKSYGYILEEDKSSLSVARGIFDKLKIQAELL